VYQVGINKRIILRCTAYQISRYKVLSISAEVKLLKEEIIYRTVQQQY